MSIFGGIFKRSVTFGNLTDYNDFWFGGAPSSSGVPVNKVSAMRVAMVSTCVTLRANTLAQFPLKLKKKTGGKTEDATDLPVYNLVKLQPNPEMSSFSWRVAGQGNVDTTGNEYNWIEKSRAGIKAIWPIPPECVTIERANGQDIAKHRLTKNNRIIYVVNLGTGTPIRFPASDILHNLGFSFDGRKGQSIIGYGSNTIGNQSSVDTFQGRWMANGIHTSGTFEHPETLGDNAESFKAALKERYSGSANAGTPMILENNMKFNSAKISLVDQQFVEQSELGSLQIARLFHVPPSLVGIPGVNESNASIEQEFKKFLTLTMQPIVFGREQNLDIKLLTEQQRKDGYFFNYNIDALLRPDAEARAKIDQMMWGMGTPLNDFRDRDDKNPVEGGGTSYVPLNFTDANAKEEPIEQNRSRETRSIASRDKITKRWTPIIEATADRLVRYEANAIERQSDRQKRNRASEQFNTWVDNFYLDFRKRIVKDLGGVMSEYMRMIADEVKKEVNSDISATDIDNAITEYVDGMADQWVESDIGQIRQLVTENDPGYDEVIERAEEWRERKTKKVTDRHKISGANSMAVFIFFSTGLRAVWRIRGSFTCKYCKRLNGKTIKRGQFFADESGVDPGDGDQPLIPQGRTQFPTLHGGCDCTVTWSK